MKIKVIFFIEKVKKIPNEVRISSSWQYHKNKQNIQSAICFKIQVVLPSYRRSNLFKEQATSSQSLTESHCSCINIYSIKSIYKIKLCQESPARMF